MGSAPALCRESLHGHCARRVPGCSRLHAQPRRLASGVRTMPPRGWAGAGRGCGEGSAGGAGGGFAAAGGRGLGWNRPERGVGSCPAPPAAPPGAAGGAEARRGDARVCGGAAGPGGSRPGSPGGSWRQGALCWGRGARGRPGVETSPGRVAPGGSEGRPAGAPRAAALPAALALQLSSPRDLRLNVISP